MKKFLLSLFLIAGISLYAADTIRSISDEKSPNTIQVVKDFQTAIALFQMEGYSIVDKFGANFAIGAATTPEDIWEFGGVYPYDAFGTAPIQYVSSSSASDTELISVQGLDIEGNLVEQNITLTGQTNVTLSTPLWRVFRMENNGTSDIVGMVYAHTDAAPVAGVPAAANTRAIIDSGNNQTLMALYTIPKGKVGFLYRGELGVALEGNVAALAEFARIQYRSRRLGGVFKVKKDITCMVGGGSALYQDPRTFPDIIPSLTDIKIEVIESSQDMGAWAAFDMLLVDEDKLKPDLLRAIGQPEYD